MRFLFINPIPQVGRFTEQTESGVFPPLGIAYLAAYLRREGHAVRISDRRAMYSRLGLRLDLVDTAVLEQIRTFQPDVVGFSATTAQMQDVQHFSPVVRTNFAGATLICGGPHPTALPAEVLRACPSIDFAVVGEGERPLLALAGLGGTGSVAAGAIPGLAGRAAHTGSPVLASGCAETIDNLDRIPHPARDLLDMAFYLRVSTERTLFDRMTSLITSRGCPYSCHFCAGSLTKKVRFHSPAYVVEEVRQILQEYPAIEVLYFADDFFLADVQRATRICEGLVEAGIPRRAKWVAQLRPAVINSDEARHLQVLGCMRRAGCIQVEYGFESGSQEELDRMNKRATVSDYRQVIALGRRAALKSYANIIVGFLGQTEADLRRTYEFIEESRPDSIQVSRFHPLPGTHAYRQLQASGSAIAWEASTIAGATDLNYTAMEDAVLAGHVARLMRYANAANSRHMFGTNLRRHPLRTARLLAQGAVNRARPLWRWPSPRRPGGPAGT